MVYILVDFENVHGIPKILNPQNTRLLIFMGPQDKKISVDLARRVQILGDRAKYISVTESGPESLDHWLVYQLAGEVAKDPAADFTIVSKDRGYDSLIKTLIKQGTKIKRMTLDK